MKTRFTLILLVGLLLGSVLVLASAQSGTATSQETAAAKATKDEGPAPPADEPGTPVGTTEAPPVIDDPEEVDPPSPPDPVPPPTTTSSTPSPPSAAQPAPSNSSDSTKPEKPKPQPAPPTTKPKVHQHPKPPPEKPKRPHPKTVPNPAPSEPEVQTQPEDRAGYCSAAGNTWGSGPNVGQPIKPGTYLDLYYQQPASDPHYAGATLAVYVEGTGLTCLVPKGYVQKGYAGDPQNVPTGRYLLYGPA